MTQYIKDSEDKTFIELSGDETFRSDLEKFFRGHEGSRYNYTKEEIDKMGYEQLADEFVEHMRYQSTNETTAVKDLLYAQRNFGTKGQVAESANRDYTLKEGQKAFGRLMQAYDRSEGGGTGKLEGAWDYATAFATSPSTVLSVGTLGMGVGSKVAAKATGRAVQLSLRSQLSKMISEGVTDVAIKETLKKGYGGAALKGAAISSVPEAAIGAGMGYSGLEARKLTNGEDYTTGQVVAEGVLAGVLGGTVGAGAKMWDTRVANKAVDVTQANIYEGMKVKAHFNKEAKKQLATVPKEILEESKKDVVDIANLLRANMMGEKLNPLDKDQVAKGLELKKKISSDGGNEMLEVGLDTDTLKGILAATTELKLNLLKKTGAAKGERITATIARGLTANEDGVAPISPQMVMDIRDKYGLSKEEFSYIFLAEFSRAGKLLSEASKIKKAVANVDVLAAQGISSFSDRQVKEIFEEAGGSLKENAKEGVGDGYNIPSKLKKGLADADQLRIAFMTTQLGTTAANASTQTFNTVVDVSDKFWTNVLGSTLGRKMPDGSVSRRWVGGTLNTIKGLTTNRAEAAVAKDMLMNDAPLKYRDLFYETTKTLNQADDNSFISRLGRGINVLNIATDSVFKEASLYSSIDRQLREVGDNFSNFVASGKSLQDLENIIVPNKPEGFNILDAAIDEAKRFTFQKDYKGDVSLFGKTASKVQKLHRDYPFLISVGLDLPFPRYMANHIEYISDYTAAGLIPALTSKVDGDTGKIFNNLLTDEYKTGHSRMAKQLTGASMIMTAFGIAASKNGEIDYDKLKTKEGNVDTSRIAGPFAMHLLIGDLLYRHTQGMPTITPAFKTAFGDVMGGVPDLKSGVLSLEFPFMKELIKSVGQGEATNNLEKYLGNIVSTFTYPATFAKDIISQIDSKAAGSPYTRPFNNEQEVSNIGERNLLEDIVNSNMLKNQATRFLFDSNLFSYTQSFKQGSKEGYDYKKYSIFNPYPVGSYSPITKSWGRVTEPPNTAIQKEIVRLGLNPFELYTNRSVPNSSLAHQVEYNLSQKLNKRFLLWKKGAYLGGKGGFREMTYDQLSKLPSNTFDVQQKKAEFLKQFIDEHVKKETEAVEAAFEEALMSDDVRVKRRAVGYIRNVYELETSNPDNPSVEEVLSSYPEYFNQAKTASDYLASSGSIEEEIERRQLILEQMKKLKDMNSPLPVINTSRP